MIACTHEINFGMPSIKGRRITVYNVLTSAWYADDIDDINEELNDKNLNLNDLFDSVNYCKNLKCKTDTERLHYCDGCILRTIEEGLDNDDREKYDETEVEEYIITFIREGKPVIF